MGGDAQGGGESTRRIAPFFRDLGVTVLAQAAVALGGLWLARLLAIRTGTDGFASYSLVKQAVNVFFPIVTVGLVGGLPRYLALPARGRGPAPEGYLAAAALICGAATAVVAGTALALPDLTARVFFGSPDETRLVAPFAGLLGATSAFYVAFGWFRGRVRMRAAALIQVAGFALVPPGVVLALPGRPVDEIIAWMAALLGALSVAAVIATAPARPARSAAGAHGRGRGHALHLRPPPGPGRAGPARALRLRPPLAAHVGSATDVAYLSAGQQVLSVLSIAVLPVGLLMLPSLTRIWATDREAATGHVARLSALSLHLALFASLQTLLFADIAVRAWLGPGFDDAGAVVRVTVSPAALFVVYLMLRSALDAVAVVSYNSRNNLVALAVFAGVAAISLGADLGRPVMCVAWSFAIGVAVQGVLTFATVHRLFRLQHADYGLRVALPAALVAGAAGAALRPLVDGASAELVWLIVVQAVLAAAYLAVLIRARVPWTRLIADRLFQARS